MHGAAAATYKEMHVANTGASGVTHTGAKRAALPGRAEAPFCLYITFDDGPSAGSPLVSELVREKELPVNVFLIGRNVCLTDRSRELFREYKANPLIEIGNHSFTHAERRYQHYFKQPGNVLADFNRSRDSLRMDNGLTRLPGRNFFRIAGLSRNEGGNGKEAADTLAANGYSIFGWDLEWRREVSKGFEKHTAREMLDIVATMLNDGKTFLPGRLILLLHEQELQDTAFTRQLQDFIQLAKDDGKYRFGHLSDCVVIQRN